MRKTTIPKIAYIMSRFPKLTETFILYEILELQKYVDVEIYPLLRESQHVVHPEADRLVQKAYYRPFVSRSILRAQRYFIQRSPQRYFRTLTEVLTGTIPSPNFFSGAIAIFPKVVQFAYEMERNGITHIHAHFANHPALAAFIIHRLTGIPFSFTAHGSDVHVDRTMLHKKVNASAFTVTVSKYNKQLITRECGQNCRDKVLVVHCGVDTDLFTPRGEKENSSSFEILSVGRLEEVKGHRYLIEACRILAKRGLDFRCRIVGEGPLKPRLERQIARSGLGNRVYLLGPQPRPQVLKLLQEADVFALTSVSTRRGRREGIPVVLMEAMASGLPVVSTVISGIPELVEAGLSGFLAPPRNSAAVADMLQMLGNNPWLRHAMGRAGRSKVEEEFDLKKNAAKLRQLFTGEDDSEFETDVTEITTEALGLLVSW